MELRVNPDSITANEDGTMTVSGYVNRTNKLSELLGYVDKFREKIAPGAWRRALEKGNEIHFLAEHDNKVILSSTRNNSLHLEEDDTGLKMTATISPTSWGKDYYQLIQDKILRNMSFGFKVLKDTWQNMGDYFERTVQDLELYEVSVVRDPAYSSSSISARGIDLVEDVEIPDEVRNNEEVQDGKPLYEIRSEEDLNAIAAKIFEMIKASAISAEAPIVDENPEEEKPEEVEQPSEEKVDEPKPEEQPEQKADEEVKAEDIVEEVVEEKVEEPEEVVEEIEQKQSEAEKLREFINTYKNQEEE